MDTRVTRARLFRFRVPFRQSYLTARGKVDAREGFLVELETASGVTGLGEASLRPEDGGIDAFGELVAASVRAAMGREVSALTAPGEGESTAASAAIEIAAWDALARASGRPLASLLAGGALVEVPVNALVTALAPESVYVQASEARRAGFETVKLKVGICESAKQEVERVMAARSAIGPAARLRLDANGAWSEHEALSMVKTFAPYQPEYVEQPVAPDNLEAMRMIRESTRIPIAADEDVTDAAAAMRVLNAAAADVLVLKPLQLGGITASRRVAEAAAQAGVDVVVTTTIDSGIGTAAALHLAASFGGGEAAGLATLGLLEASLITEELPVVRGRMTLPAQPGLGVTLDREAVARYLVSEEAFA